MVMVMHYFIVDHHLRSERVAPSKDEELMDDDTHTGKARDRNVKRQAKVEEMVEAKRNSAEYSHQREDSRNASSDIDVDKLKETLGSEGMQHNDQTVGHGHDMKGEEEVSSSEEDLEHDSDDAAQLCKTGLSLEKSRGRTSLSSPCVVDGCFFFSIRVVSTGLVPIFPKSISTHY